MDPYRAPAAPPVTALALVRDVRPLEVGDVVRVIVDERSDLRGRTGQIGLVVMLSGELHAVTFRDSGVRFYRRADLRRVRG